MTGAKKFQKITYSKKGGGYNMVTREDSPCLTCTRVKDPKNCENKTCKPWQAWFLAWWKGMQSNVRSQMPQTEQSESASNEQQ